MSKIIKDISILRQQSTSANIEEAKSIIKELEVTLEVTDNALGIAAVQIGYLKTVGVVRLKDNSVFALINPELISSDDEFIYHKESCLSFPGIFKNIKRYGQILIKNHRIEDDKLIEEKLAFNMEDDGLATISIQHEFEHFNGITILNKENIKEEPIKRESEKVGRNDKCSCGSGLKYKKCCGKGK